MTLIEVIISFVIVAMLVMSFYSIFSNSVKQTSDEQYSDQTLQISRAVMDAVRVQAMNKDSITLFDQPLDFQRWKCTSASADCNATPAAQVLLFPDKDHPQFTVTVNATQPDGNVNMNLLPATSPAIIQPTGQTVVQAQPEAVNLALKDYLRVLILDVKDPSGKTRHFESVFVIK